MRSDPKDESGYSLVEVMVAIIILTIAIIPMVGMFDSGLRSATTSGNYDKARALANANLEQIKSQPFPSSEGTLPCPNLPIGSTFTCSLETSYRKLNISGDSGTFQDGDAADGMMRVKATVEWGNGKSYSATGLVSK